MIEIPPVAPPANQPDAIYFSHEDQAASVPHAPIDVINLQDFLNGSSRQRQNFIQTLGQGFVETGFVLLEGHGIPDSLIRSCYKLAATFFDLEDEEKQKYERQDWARQRGYTRFGHEHAKGNDLPDLKEFWHVGRLEDPVATGLLPNVWPNASEALNFDQAQTFQADLSELYAALDRTALSLLDALGQHLGEKPENLADIAVGGNSLLRVIHYPAHPKGLPAGSVRAAAHEDINLITLLVAATDDGLQLFDRQGRWLEVESQPGQIIVDAGDMLQNLTNGYYRSTTHRVVGGAESKSARFSMPFFCHPRPETSLEPLASCVTRTGGKAVFPALTAGQFLTQRLLEIGLQRKDDNPPAPTSP